MKMTRRAASLVAMAAVLLALLLWLAAVRRSGSQDSAPRKDLIIPYAANEIKSIRIDGGPDGSLEFERNTGLWSCVSHPEIRVDQTKAGTLAASVTGVSVEHVIDDPEDLEEYGLEKPAMTLEVRKSGGGSVSVSVGDTNETTLDVYCLKDGDRSTVYAVSTALTVCLDQPASYYMEEEGAD